MTDQPDAGTSRHDTTPDDDFRWHVLSECPDESACPIHGRNVAGRDAGGEQDA